MSATGRTRVIAHRGASGYLPEHTLAAKILAFGLGADFLEQDVVATRDGELVVLHDTYLDDVSDVAKRYPDRIGDDGRYYVIELDLAELRELRIVERRRPGSKERLRGARFAPELDDFRIVTLAEELELVRGLNATMGRNVGIYPELKEPRWHRDHGIDISARLVELLERYRYLDTPDSVFVQCFDATELERLKLEFGVELPLIQLVDAATAARLSREAGLLERMSSYAAGIGLPYASLLHEGRGLRAGPLSSRLADAGLMAHPYTFRRDEAPDPAVSFEALLAFFIHDLGVDALFCDHPDVALAVRDGV